MADGVFSVVVARVKSGGSLVQEAPAMLAFVAKQEDPGTLRECKAQAAAVAAYLAQRKDVHVEEYNAAIKVRMRTEHRLGEVLAVTVNHTRGVGNTVLPTLPVEITRMQSSRAQRLACVPWENIDTAIDSLTARNERARPASVVRPFLRAEVEKAAEDKGGCTVEDLRQLIDQGERFGTVCADPPWPYANQGTRAATGGHYAAMTLEDIAALPVARLAAPESHLHLWTTNAFLPHALRVIEAWGFEYKSVFVWCKPQMGIGNYWRVSHEFLLLGVRGGCPFRVKDLWSWQSIDRGRHSAKPEQVYLNIEKASPPARLELFGRMPRQGWTVWGNQIESNLFHNQEKCSQ